MRFTTTEFTIETVVTVHQVEGIRARSEAMKTDIAGKSGDSLLHRIDSIDRLALAPDRAFGFGYLESGERDMTRCHVPGAIGEHKQCSIIFSKADYNLISHRGRDMVECYSWKKRS